MFGLIHRRKRGRFLAFRGSGRTFASLCLLLAWAGVTSLNAEPDGLHAALDYEAMLKKHESMDTGGLSRELRSALSDYFQLSCGGPATWQKIQSLRMEGVLRLPDRDIQFVAFKKKPAYTKIVLKGADGPIMVMAFDGKDAWQLIPSESEEPVAMPPAEAVNFMRDAVFGTHLFYPVADGKETILLENEEINGWLCRNIRVLLPNGDEVTYALSIRNALPRRQVTKNHHSGLLETTIYEEFKQIDGVSLPARSVLWVEGVKLHEVHITDFEFNLGIMPWMFSRPSGAYLPGPSKSSELESLDPSNLGPSDSGVDSLGLFPNFSTE